jgi:hypothetical protein
MNPSSIPNQPNAFERMLPDIGGTAGSLIGGIIGGAGGVAGGAAIPGADLTGVPEVAGGIGGAKIGSTVGAGIGGGAGKAAEDLLTHHLNISSIPGIAGSALENAIGNVVGLGLNKVGGAVMGGAKSLLGKAAEGRATQAGEQAARQETADASKAATDRAAAFKNNYGSLSSRLQQDLKLGSNAKIVDQMGFDSANPADMKKVSGAGLDLNGIYDAALKNAKPVDMSDFGTKVYGDMQKNGITDLGTTPLGKAISEAQIPLNEKNLQLPATQVRQLQQAVGTQIGNTRKLINNAELQGVSNTEAEAQLKNLQDTYKDLGARIKTPEVDAAIAGSTISDADRAALVSKYGDKLGNNVADTINSAKSADDLLKPMQQFTQMSHASDMALNDIENAPATARGVARAQAANPSPEKPTADKGSNVIDALALGGAPFTHGASLLGLLPHAVKAAGSPGVQDAALSALNKVTGSKTAGDVVSGLTRAGGIAGANLLNEQPSPAASAIPGSPAAATAPAASGASVLGQAYQQELADQGNLMDLAGRVPANYGGAGLAGAATGLGGVVAGLAPQVQKQNLAGEALSGVMPAYEQAGGAQGTLGGLLSQATSMIPGSPANTYQREQATAAATLASLLGISPVEAQGLLPRLTQNPGTAATPMGQTGSVLDSLRLPQLSLGQ